MKSFKLIESYNQLISLYEKGIEIIEPFRLQNINVENDFSYESKGCYKNRDFDDLVNNQAKPYINRIDKNP